MSVPNGIAKIGVNLTAHNISTGDFIYAWDNEPNNNFVVSRIEYAVRNNHKVFLPLWDYKDLNEAKMSGMSETDIEQYIFEHSYKGAKALLQFYSWKKGLK